jgi:hypothetical protein
MADPVAGTVMTTMTSSAYTSAGGNPFKSPYCTWYCWGRTKEKSDCGKAIKFSQDYGRDADKWMTLVTNCVTKDSDYTPTGDIIACFSVGTGCSGGHVAFIEAVRTTSDGGMNIYFTEGGAGHNGILQEKSLTDFKKLYGHVLQGYLIGLKG